MKPTGKLAILVLLMVLLLPLQTARASGLAEGPIFGNSFTLKNGETYKDDVIVFGGSVSIEKDARVDGNVILFGGSFTLNGDVTKDVVVIGGAVKLDANAHIHGKLITLGAPTDRVAGATVDEGVFDDPTRPTALLPSSAINLSLMPVVDGVTNPLVKMIGILTWSFVLALIAMLIALLMPMQMRRVADGFVAQPFITFGMGLLSLILFIVAVVALGLFSVFIFTMIVTLPLILIVSVVFTVAYVLGWLALGMEVGVRIAQMFNREWPLPLAAGLGIFLLNMGAQGLEVIIPCLGGMITGLIGFVGLGAVLMTRFGTRVSSLSIAPLPATEPASAVINN